MPRFPRSRARLLGVWVTTTALLLCLPAALTARLRRLEERSREEGRDGGYSTEFMVITALLIAAAIAILAIIGKKLTDKANGLNL